MRTAPFNMQVAPMSIDAARALGRHVGQLDDSLPGVVGSKDVVIALIEGYVQSKSPGSSRVVAEDRRDLLYELEDLVTPTSRVQDGRREKMKSSSWRRC